MSDFLEFQARTLDQAIQDACEHFGTERGKLEIDILEDAKSGIFGLVGARKARVNARLAQLSIQGITGAKSGDPKARKGAAPTLAPSTPRAAKEKNTSVKAEMDEKAQAEKIAVSKSNTRSSTASPAARDTRNDRSEVVKTAKPNDRPSRHQGFEEDEEGESQRKFLSKIIPHDDDDDELDENVLEALDREAMARAHLLGNATEAEIRASGQSQDSSDRRNLRGKNVRGREAPRGRNDRVRGQGFERDDKRAPFGERPAPAPRGERPAPAPRGERPAPAPRGERSLTPAQKDARREEALERKQFYEQKRQQQREAHPPRQIVVAEYEASPLPRIALEELDTEKLIALTRETILQLVGNIVGFDAPLEIKIVDDRVHVSIESEDTGLLIGREGQHLAAVQYLASRILTRKMESQIRIQVDTGDYHSRQDSRMEFLAQALAEKVKATGRPQSTRPLSAYQRRVIHLALQEETEIQTRSCGDGTLKRVIIMRRRHPAGTVTNNQVDNAESENLEEDFISEPDLNKEFVAEEYENTPHETLSEDNSK